MKLQFLGTSAGELYPGIWCQCHNCDAARLGISEDRRQSAALYMESVADNTTGLLIDFPPEIASQLLRYSVPVAGLQHLLVTHSHGDHWFPYQLRWRSRPSETVVPNNTGPISIGGPRFTSLSRLHVWGNAAVESIMYRELGMDLGPYEIEFHCVMPGDTFKAGIFAVTAVHANHDVGREEALHYIIQEGGKTILYGLDGDTFLPETREQLRKFQFNLVIMESTYGYGDGGNHRNFARLVSEAEWFRREGLLTTSGIVVATHFSPHHCPPHLECAAYLKQHDIIAAWDGMEMQIEDRRLKIGDKSICRADAPSSAD